MKKLLLILSLLFISLSLYSQNASIKVNNLEIGQVYTDTQIRSSLGTPTSIRLPSPNDDEAQNITVYMYNENAFLFMDGEFISFGLRDTTFSVNGFLKVGDSMTKLNQMAGVLTTTETPHINEWSPSAQYRSDKGYLNIYFIISTQKIYLLGGEVSRLLL
jgi:hypothetical protein